MRRLSVGPVSRALLLILGVVLLPTIASAQSIVGVIRDPSGGVLPGVIVEASSPALIEKVRTTTSDGSGQFRLDALAAGVSIAGGGRRNCNGTEFGTAAIGQHARPNRRIVRNPAGEYRIDRCT